MARMKRVIVPGYPHHVVQRGVRSMDIFSEENDRLEYLRFLRSQGDRFGVKFLSYCLMTNHVHLLAIPQKSESLARAIGEAHRLYSRMINFRDGVRGYLFQGRFSSCPVSTDQYLVASLRYILRNPVKAKLVKQPWDYPWSSASYHCGIETDDILSQDDDLLSVVEDWKKLLSVDDERSQLLEKRNRTGRPFGPDAFYDVVKQKTGIDTRPKEPGRPTKKQ